MKILGLMIESVGLFFILWTAQIALFHTSLGWIEIKQVLGFAFITGVFVLGRTIRLGGVKSENKK